MKTRTLIAAVAALTLLAACVRIPDESIYTELDSAAMQKVTKKDSTFANFYEGVRDMVGYYGPNEQFELITYRRLWDYIKSFSDTAYLSQLNDQWEQEWEKLAADNINRGDSLVKVWQEYVDAHPDIDLQEEITKEEPAIPKAVIGCLLSKDDPRLYEWVRDMMITSQIDSNHVGKNSYLDDKFVEYSRGKDSLCYLFIFSGMM